MCSGRLIGTVIVYRKQKGGKIGMRRKIVTVGLIVALIVSGYSAAFAQRLQPFGVTAVVIKDGNGNFVRKLLAPTKGVLLVKAGLVDNLPLRPSPPDAALKSSNATVIPVPSKMSMIAGWNNTIVDVRQPSNIMPVTVFASMWGGLDQKAGSTIVYPPQSIRYVSVYPRKSTYRHGETVKVTVRLHYPVFEIYAGKTAILPRYSIYATQTRGKVSSPGCDGFGSEFKIAKDMRTVTRSVKLCVPLRATGSYKTVAYKLDLPSSMAGMRISPLQHKTGTKYLSLRVVR